MTHTRSAIRHRARTVVLTIGAVAILAVVGIAVGPSWGNRSTHQDPKLTIRYRTDTPVVSAVAKPWLEIINTSDKEVALSDIQLRYYFTAGPGAAYGVNCVQAEVGCSNVAALTASLPTPAVRADHYIELFFAKGAGNLAPGQNSKGLQLQFYRLDHKEMNQADDRSFNGTCTTFRPSTLITAYVSGVRVWGEEPIRAALKPNSGSPSTAFSATASTTSVAGALVNPTITAPAQTAVGAGPQPAIIPLGVVFDAFRYSGASDPAFKNHGWGIRISAGGPGIRDTWTAAGVSFPAESSASGGQVMQLRASTDGTKAGTTQAEVESSNMRFTEGTFAARVFLADSPTSGKPGDAINQSFYTVAPETGGSYSELDNEYMPNGWGSVKGPILDTTSWFDAKTKDRVTQRHQMSLAGWHTLVINVANGVVNYSVDGTRLFTSTGRYYPHTPMVADFNAWFGDLYATGFRVWDMKVNWFYYNTNGSMTAREVTAAVKQFYAQGSVYIDTVKEP